jgi:hypothetical protein
MNSIVTYPKKKCNDIDPEQVKREFERRKEKVWQHARMMDAQYELYNNPKYIKKERYGVFSDGSIRDIYQYKKELYTYYDGNNPVLNQGGPISVSMRGLNGKKIDEAYEKTKVPPYLSKYPSV